MEGRRGVRCRWMCRSVMGETFLRLLSMLWGAGRRGRLGVVDDGGVEVVQGVAASARHRGTRV